MVLFTPEKLIFKGSKKQHQILAQTAYYQAGKIVVQTILPEQPPVALITLNTLGTTCSTSADTYIPIENIFNTQSCSSLESRLVSLYGGKAASLLIESEQRLKFFNKNNNSGPSKKGLTKQSSPVETKATLHSNEPVQSKALQRVQKKAPIGYGAILFQRGQKLTKQKIGKRSQASTEIKLINNVADPNPIPLQGKGVSVRNFSKLTLLPNRAAELRLPQRGMQSKEWKPNSKARLVKTCFAGAGNNIFQSTLGNIEIQTATRLARIMVNYWNFYSLNKISLYSLVNKYAPAHNSFGVAVHRKRSINSINKLANFSNSSSNDSSFNDSSFGAPRAVARKRILPYKSTICKASARLELLRSSSNAMLASPTFYKSKNSIQTENLDGIQYPVKGKTLHANNANGIANLANRRFASFASLFARGYASKQLKDQEQKDLFYILKEKSVAKELEAEGDTKRKCNVRVWGIKLKVKDKTPQGNIKYKIAKLNSGYPIPHTPYPYGVQGYRGKQIEDLHGVCQARNNLYFAIAQSKHSLKICENKNSSYNIQRLSIENIGNYSQLNTNNFQLINLLQFSHLQRDRFYPNWFRLYLPDMEATEFLKNIANYYFSLGLQTLTFPSTKSSYSLASSGALEKLNVSTASPFLSFLNKNTQKEKYKLFIPNISSYTYCPPAILTNSPSVKSITLRNKLTPLYPYRVWGQGSVASEQDKWFCKSKIYPSTEMNPYPEGVKGSGVSNTIWVTPLPRTGMGYAKPTKMNPYPERFTSVEGYRIHFSGARDIKDPSFTKVEGVRLDPLNVPFSLLLESQIFPLNYNGFSIVEKELLYNTLVNSSFAKAFYLINQNRQLLDFFVDYLLRFQILRQHQILYLFSTLLLGCNKRV